MAQGILNLYKDKEHENTNAHIQTAYVEGI